MTVVVIAYEQLPRLKHIVSIATNVGRTPKTISIAECDHADRQFDQKENWDKHESSHWENNAEAWEGRIIREQLFLPQ